MYTFLMLIHSMHVWKTTCMHAMKLSITYYYNNNIIQSFSILIHSFLYSVTYILGMSTGNLITPKYFLLIMPIHWRRNDLYFGRLIQYYVQFMCSIITGLICDQANID